MYSYLYIDSLEDFARAIALFAGDKEFSQQAMKTLYNYYKAEEVKLGMALHVDFMELVRRWTEEPGFIAEDTGKKLPIEV